MNIGKLTQRVTVEQIITTGTTQTWSVFATAWASVRGSTEADREIKIRYRTGITALMYIKYGNEVMAITDIVDPDGKRTELKLTCKEETVEAVELQTMTPTQDSEGKPLKSYAKAADLLGVVIPKEADIEQRQQGTIYRRQFEVNLKGAYRHASMTIGHGMKVQGVNCDIKDVQDHTGKLIVLKLRER